MIPDFFILIVGAVFLTLSGFLFYLLFKIQDMEKTLSGLANAVLTLSKKPNEEGDKP